MHHLGGDVYFKLIWHMTAITACPIHRSPLLAKCDFCGCDQSGYIKKYPLDFVKNAGAAWLFDHAD